LGRFFNDTKIDSLVISTNFGKKEKQQSFFNLQVFIPAPLHDETKGQEEKVSWKPSARGKMSTSRFRTYVLCTIMCA